LAGFLTYVSDLRQPPIALVATHFTEVCDAALVPRVPATQFLTMRVHLPEDDNDINDVNNVKGADDDRVVFLYRAVPGVSSRAYSLRCARDAGLPVSVLARCEALEAVDGGVSGGGVVEPDPGVVRAVAPRVRRNEGVVRALAGLDLGAGFDAARKVIMGAMGK
jgi:DNA mismatch repair protein MSH5